MMSSLAVAAPLLLGAALAVLALGFVLWPLWIQATATTTAAPPRPRAPVAEGESPIEALREIEFDRATGKLSDDDYAVLKSRYTQQALVEMRAAEATPGAAGDAVAPDAAEAEVLRHRARRRGCVTCGPRPEPDATFCSSCGSYLFARCGACGADVENVAARFCTSCGHSFAAVA